LAFEALGGLRVVGAERVPLEGPLVVAPNHVSLLDPPIVGCASPRALCFMAKEELFRVPILGPLIRSLDAFPVRRGEGDTEAIRRAVGLLKAGHAVLVFPEGTRGDGEELLPISPGVAMLAKRTEAVVLPVGIVGTHVVWPKSRRGLRRARMTVVFGEPFRFSDIPGGRDAFAGELAARIAAACREGGLAVKAAPGSSPPASSPTARRSTEEPTSGSA
jgi:1-acyl-sn-glycerol-3-phosphate acyltransferase